MIDPYPSLHQTVRVAADGTVTHGIDVPHEAANIPCGHILGEYEPWGKGEGMVAMRCKKRVGHSQPKDEAAHVPQDFRLLAAPVRVAHVVRFAPGGIPKGVDQTTPNRPHDCANHLPDTIEVLRRGW